MVTMRRIYDLFLSSHLRDRRQMAFVTGPRQVGKTTTCQQAGTVYFDWDYVDHARLILQGPAAIAHTAGLDRLTDAGTLPVLVFDELHKYPHWKKFLKGFFDLHEKDCRILVTGSSRLDMYRRGGDSLMGRYFLYRMHPFSVAELVCQELPDDDIVRAPRAIDPGAWADLNRFGGFPEPLFTADAKFSRRWQGLRHAQRFKEDARDLTRVQDIALLELLGRLLDERSGDRLVVANLARNLSAAPNTIKSWVDVLCALHAGFLVRPWFRNVSSAIRKEPKWYLRDWSTIADPGKRYETMMAVHLLKAVEGWTDLGLGAFLLFYVRDKQKREVDFVVTRDNEPWFIVEAKRSETRIAPNLHHFQKQIGAAHAFQVVHALPYVDADCFSRTTPCIVPATTFLSQLL